MNNDVHKKVNNFFKALNNLKEIIGKETPFDPITEAGMISLFEDLPQHVHDGIIKLTKKYGVKKVILFGSRARGDNWERSDVDLAISGGNRTMFSLDVDEIEIVPTLLMFDVVDFDSGCNEELRAEIERDGVILYEEW